MVGVGVFGWLLSGLRENENSGGFRERPRILAAWGAENENGPGWPAPTADPLRRDLPEHWKAWATLSYRGIHNFIGAPDYPPALADEPEALRQGINEETS